MSDKSTLATEPETLEPGLATPQSPRRPLFGAATIAFLIVAAIGGTVFAVITPAFWGHDEITQFGRAYQVAHGGMLPQQIPDDRGVAYGGDVPVSVDALMAYALNDYANNPPEPEPMVESPEDYDRLESAAVSDGRATIWFSNTAAYSPATYLPSAAGIRIAEALGSSVGGLLLSARLAGLAAYLALAGYAINTLRAYRIGWLAFTLALLPIAVFQAGTITADTVTNGVALTVSALLVKAVFLGARLTRPESAVLLASAVLLPLCKPTYLLLAMLVVVVPVARLGWTRRMRWLPIVAAAAGAALFLAWTKISAGTTEGMGRMRPQAQWYSVVPEEQLSGVLHDPAHFVAVFFRTLMLRDQLYFIQFFGELGFGYVQVPGTAIVSALLAIVLAFGMSERLRSSAAQTWITAAVVLLTVGMIFGTLYLSFSPVGYHFIDGVQGRYFIPIALVGAAVLLRWIPLRVVGATGAPPGRGTAVAVVALTATSLLATILRYYFVVW
ncbi:MULTISPECIES: DUF2142 domain-containing protein [Rhodococcus]|uniref:DUF2142 domain-containing protein n=1 Tax=Rhodococcus TaxID=1827 RepID=UPI000F532CB9|nr:DUF2142 domain-containing protein [Rhodococcus ruber]QRE79380.1 DUF2142 domain-containing protein [Rhodococcus ruber]RQM34063.1 hypothetical protein TN91_11645 [Rhodococcus ruber]